MRNTQSGNHPRNDDTNRNIYLKAVQSTIKQDIVKAVGAAQEAALYLMIIFSSSFLSAPTTLSTSFPPLASTNVGIASTLNSCATSCNGENPGRKKKDDSSFKKKILLSCSVDPKNEGKSMDSSSEDRRRKEVKRNIKTVKLLQKAR